MPLDVRTHQLIREAFAGERCCHCDGPATRFLRGKYYCHDHVGPHLPGASYVTVRRVVEHIRGARLPRTER